MKKLFAFAVLTVLLSPAPARAQDADLCRIMTAYKPPADVNYQPGVDVHGKPVVPADLNAPMPQMVDVVRIPLTVNLADRLNGSLPAGTELEGVVGMLEIHRDGRVIYNGQDLTSAAKAVCGGKSVPAVITAPVQVEATAPPTGNPQTLTQPAPPFAQPPPEPAPKPQDDVIFGESH